MEDKAREDAQKQIDKWVDPRPKLKSQEEWEEVFDELAGYIKTAEGAVAEATKEIESKEAELAAQIADVGPRRDHWKTTWEKGQLDRQRPFPGVPQDPLD